jgi:ribonuclease E
MTKRMLIDATHAEETRVVVLDGSRLEDFDVETSTKRQLKGNIYLAKVVRVEPSLQAAFVEYGAGRHGFLAFGEIHPDYYQIPVADRQRLLALQAEEARAEEEAEEEAASAQGEGAPRKPAFASSPESEQPAEPEDELPAEAEDEFPGEAEEFEEGGNVEDVEPTPLRADVEQAEERGEREAESAYDTEGIDLPPPAIEPAVAEAASEPAGPVEANAAVPTGTPESTQAVPPPAAEPAPAEPTVPEAVASQTVAVESPAAGPDMTAAETPAPASPAPAEPSPTAGEPGPDAPDDERAARSVQPAAIPRDEKFGPAEDVPNEPAAEDQTEALDSDFDTPDGDTMPPEPPPETIGGDNDAADGAEEARARRTSRFLRNYRIQEVIKRRQILLVQVVKEERGTKGAALTTYISLAGRFCVLMPNSPRGGGISRKITSAADRQRLKEITAELQIPPGMGLIVRTAGANRPKPEIRRDCEYLMRLWDDIRDHTLRSIAPALIYEEASLIKRAIRDVYSRDIDEVLVDGEAGWRAAHDFMRMLMPTHARKVILWRGGGQPLFAKHQVEAQLDAMLSPTVQLRSGGYLVINQTEALVAIDVNSGRSTRERGIEETALRTNLEAADEVARQLRLRDLAGLIVIDLIDMEAKKHNAMVERRLKEALKVDRARIQVGHISHFGLLEMSRQRLRPSLAETSFVTCPHCAGLGQVRSVESSAIHVLRGIEEEGAKARAALIMVYVATPVALYLLNSKRDRLAEVETSYAMRVHFTPDDTLLAPQMRIERLKPQVPETERLVPAPVAPAPMLDTPEDAEEEEAIETVEEAEPVATAPVAEPVSAPEQANGAEAPSAEENERRRRRRRRRRGVRRENGGVEGAPGGQLAEGESGEDSDGEELPEPEPVADGGAPAEASPSVDVPVAPDAPEAAPAEPVAAADAAGEEQPNLDPNELDENGLPRARRRSRRGGRRRRRGETTAEVEAEAIPSVPAYSGPTPADPFGGAYDIFDLIDTAEEVPSAAAPQAPEPAPAAAAVTPPTEVPAEPAPPAETREPTIGPPLKPLVIGQDEIPIVERKRGWWRR